jgi:hypothetical protein
MNALGLSRSQDIHQGDQWVVIRDTIMYLLNTKEATPNQGLYNHKIKGISYPQESQDSAMGANSPSLLPPVSLKRRRPSQRTYEIREISTTRYLWRNYWSRRASREISVIFRSPIRTPIRMGDLFGMCWIIRTIKKYLKAI